jgi:hypothetical protein
MKTTKSIRDMASDGFLEGMRKHCEMYLAGNLDPAGAAQRVSAINTWVDAYYADFNRRFSEQGKATRLILPMLYDASLARWEAVDASLAKSNTWTCTQVTEYKEHASRLVLRVGISVEEFRHQMVGSVFRHHPSMKKASEFLVQATRVREAYFDDCKQLRKLEADERKERRNAARQAVKAQKAEEKLRAKLPKKKRAKEGCNGW